MAAILNFSNSSRVSSWHPVNYQSGPLKHSKSAKNTMHYQILGYLQKDSKRSSSTSAKVVNWKRKKNCGWKKPLTFIKSLFVLFLAKHNWAFNRSSSLILVPEDTINVPKVLHFSIQRSNNNKKRRINNNTNNNNNNVKYCRCTSLYRRFVPAQAARRFVPRRMTITFSSAIWFVQFSSLVMFYHVQGRP